MTSNTLHTTSILLRLSGLRDRPACRGHVGQHAAAQGAVRELGHSQGAPLLSPVHDAFVDMITLSCRESAQFLPKAERKCMHECATFTKMPYYCSKPRAVSRSQRVHFRPLDHAESLIRHSTEASRTCKCGAVSSIPPVFFCFPFSYLLPCWRALEMNAPSPDLSTLQIGHSIRSCDVPSLYRDFGIVIVNAFDTEVKRPPPPPYEAFSHGFETPSTQLPFFKFCERRLLR